MSEPKLGASQKTQGTKTMRKPKAAGNQMDPSRQNETNNRDKKEDRI